MSGRGGEEWTLIYQKGKLRVLYTPPRTAVKGKMYVAKAGRLRVEVGGRGVELTMEDVAYLADLLEKIVHEDFDSLRLVHEMGTSLVDGLDKHEGYV